MTRFVLYIITYIIFKSLSFSGEKLSQQLRYSTPSRLFLQPRGLPGAFGPYRPGVKTKPRGDVSTSIPTTNSNNAILLP